MAVEKKMMEKYELTDEKMEFNGRTLHRIRALRDFGDVKAGELGGFIEHEKNLSMCGNSWIGKNAAAFENAMVFNNARLDDKAVACGSSTLWDNSLASGDSRLCGEAVLANNAWVHGSASLSGRAFVLGDSNVFGDVALHGNFKLTGEAYVFDNSHIIKFQGFGRELRETTAYTGLFGIIVSCGCFVGNLEEFRAIVKKTHGDNQYAKEYLMMADLIEMRLTPIQEKVREKVIEMIRGGARWRNR